MKKHYHVCLFVFVLFLSLSGNKSFAQLIVNTLATSQQMANALVGNNGVNIANITSRCPNGAWGVFSTGATPTNLGIGSGIVLTTGSASTPFLLGSAASNFNSSGSMSDSGDTWLNTYGVTVANTYNACILEFDATPICDTIRFRYVFASEEYPDYVNSSFADAFAFFINGPGLPLGTNIALIPGTSIPININTVNNGQTWSCPPAPAGPCNHCADYISNCSGTSIVYDGMTTVLTAQAIVQACSTYHVKLSIADGTDWVFDSGVFLEQGTLACTGFNFNATNANAIEGCQDGIIVISHQLDTAVAHTFYFTIAGTATNGVDYPFMPDSIVFPQGVNTDTVHIVAVSDGFFEGSESVMFIYQPNACSPLDTTSLYILDPTTITAGADITTCSGIPGIIGNASAPGWNYHWSPTSGLSDTLIAQPAAIIPNYTGSPITQQYVLRVNTTGGCFALDSMIVTVLPGPVAAAGADISLCTGSQANIGSSSMAGYIYSWSPTTGLNDPTVSDPTFTSTWAGAGVHVTNYVVTTDFGLTCLGYDTIRITESPATFPTVTPFPPVCENGSPVFLWGANPFGGVWSGAGVSGGIFDPAVSGGGSFLLTYTYTNAFSCVDSDTTTIGVYPLPQVNAGVDQNICFGTSTLLVATGAANITNWNWTPPNFLSSQTSSTTSVINPSPIGTYTYSITVTDANSCVNSDVINVNVMAPPPVDAGPPSIALCIGDAINLSASGASTYVWTPSAGLSSDNVPNPTATPVATTAYTVTGTDPFNCVNTDVINVVVNPLPAMAFAGIPELCVDAAPIPLNQGSPTGGSYSGDGVTGASFDPASANVGSHTINYVYTDPSTLCSNSVSQTIIVNQLPTPDFSFTPPSASLANSVIQFTDLSADAADWKWVFGDGDSVLNVQNPVHTYNDTGVFRITMTTINTYGCKKSTSENLIVGPDLLFFSPSCFTPNGDGNNDVFFGGTGFGYYDFHMLIFDRWGNRMFETQNQSVGWDGNGATEGVYIYKINLKDFDGKPYEYLGHISLVR